MSEHDYSGFSDESQAEIAVPDPKESLTSKRLTFAEENHIEAQKIIDAVKRRPDLEGTPERIARLGLVQGVVGVNMSEKLLLELNRQNR